MANQDTTHTHSTCFGGSFGLFGGYTMATKPFVEYQITRDVAYIFGMEQLLFELDTRYQHIEVYNHRYNTPAPLAHPDPAQPVLHRQ